MGDDSEKGDNGQGGGREDWAGRLYLEVERMGFLQIHEVVEIGKGVLHVVGCAKTVLGGSVPF